MEGEAFLESPAQNGTTKTFGLDAAGRCATAASGPSGQAATSTITRGYADTSDNPAWVTTTDAAGTATTRFATSLGGDLGLTLHTLAGGGTVQAELTLTDPHGDIVATAPIPASGPCIGISSWTDHDEYGNPLAATAPIDGAGTQGLGYGWLGAKQRAATPTGLTLMGARIYNRVTGQFTSTDPIHGGGATAYAYPVDPINQFDLDGLHSCGWFSKLCSGATWVKREATSFTRGLSAGGSVCYGVVVGGCLTASVGYRDGFSAGWAANGRDKRNLGNRANYGLGAGLSVSWQNRRSPSRTYCGSLTLISRCTGSSGYRSYSFNAPSRGLWGGWTKNGSFRSWRPW